MKDSRIFRPDDRIPFLPFRPEPRNHTTELAAGRLLADGPIDCSSAGVGVRFGAYEPWRCATSGKLNSCGLGVPEGALL